MHGVKEMRIKTLASALHTALTKIKRAGTLRAWPVMQKPLVKSLDIVTAAAILGSDLAVHSRIQIVNVTWADFKGVLTQTQKGSADIH